MMNYIFKCSNPMCPSVGEEIPLTLKSEDCTRKHCPHCEEETLVRVWSPLPDKWNTGGRCGKIKRSGTDE